jgi:hypothetical protein
MKPDQVTKLYKQLTPTEQANLAIDAIKRFDDADFQLIHNSVKRCTYECLHKDYQMQIEAFERLALTYGVQYWKNQALATLALKHHDNEVNGLNSELKDLALNAWKVFLIHLGCMELALAEICTKAHIDINAVKWLAEIEDSNAFPPVPTQCNLESSEHFDFYTKLFSAAVFTDKPV